MAPKSAPVKRPEPGLRLKVRRGIVTLHLILGLTAGLLLSVTGLSGSLLVFRHEVDRLLEPEIRRVQPQPGQPVPLDDIVKAVRRTVPDAAVQQIFLAAEPHGSHEIWLSGTDRRVYVDPYSARILGVQRETESFTGWLFALHSKLLSGESGERIVGYGGVSLLLLSVSGVFLWWPDRVRQVSDRLRVKWRASAKRVNYDLHRTGGFYAALLLTLIALTGTSLVFDEWFAAAAYRITATPPAPPRPKLDSGSNTAMLPLSTILAKVDAELPGGTLRRVSFPAKPGTPLVVRKRLPGDLHPNGMSYVFLNPYSGEILRTDLTIKASRGQRLVNLRYPLHIGQWGGFVSRLLHALTGLMPLVLFVTGCRMWLDRSRRARQKRSVTP